MKTTRCAMLVAAGMVVGGLGACTGHGSATSETAQVAQGATIHVDSGGYGRVFDETRDVLRDLGFILDRVDAQLGVISTLPKGTGGIATPWDR